VALALWLRRIATSPHYLRYLVFVGVMMVGSVAGLVLSMVAVKRQWFWQPGQKTLAWTIGLSAAVIFSLAIFQVGHNLEPATTYNGKPIHPVLLRTPEVHPTYDWAGPPAAPASWNQAGYGWPGPRICTNGDHLLAVQAANQDPTKYVPRYDGLLDIYQHPRVTGTGKILSRTRFISTDAPEGLQFPVVSVTDNRLFIAYQVCLPTEAQARPQARQAPSLFSLRMLVADVSDPAQPKRLGDVELDHSRNLVFQARGDSLYGDFCYIWGQTELLVVSVADAERPQVVRRIGLSDTDRSLTVEQLTVVGDKLLCVGHGVILLLDLADPQAPRPVFRHNYRFAGLEYTTALYADDLIYLSTGAGLEIHRLRRTPTGEFRDEPLGQRRATPLERLAGRQPTELLLRQGMLYEADTRFGLLVYDVSDPTRPRRAYHAAGQGYTTTIGTWEGLLYMNNLFGSLTLVGML
jgi:hypothetical protein